MSEEKNWQFDLEEYIRQGEPEQAEKSEAWQIAIGLQQVDGLKTSAYLLDTAKEHIEGRISIDEAQKRIQSYYEERTDRKEIEDDTKEADIVSARITKLLGEKTFQFSPVEWMMIHRRLFEGVFSHAGQIRTYNITKKEWVLKGETVIYASWSSIKDTLDYDFKMEKEFSYEGYMHVDYVPEQNENTAQRAKEDMLKGNSCPLNCPLDELAILKLLLDEPTITQKELAKKIGKSERTVKNKIAALKEKGYVQRLNGKKNGKWEVLVTLS